MASARRTGLELMLAEVHDACTTGARSWHARRAGRAHRSLGLLGTDPWRNWELTGRLFPMEATIDSVGRIVVPKPLRDALGLTPGSTVDISRYGAGLQLVPTGRTARLVDEFGTLVATGDTEIDDDVVFGLIDTGRR